MKRAIITGGESRLGPRAPTGFELTASKSSVSTSHPMSTTPYT